MATKMTKKELKALRRKEREKAKLKTMKDKLEDAKNLLTDQEVLASYESSKYLTDKVNVVTKDNGIPKIGVKLFWKPEQLGFTAFTDNKSIRINAGNETYHGATRKESFMRLCGVAAHELSHVLYTNFTEFRNYITNLTNGLIYPIIPDLGPEYKEQTEQLEDLLAGKRGITDVEDPAKTNRNSLAVIVKNLFNYLEDGRVEGFFGQYCDKYKTLYNGLAVRIAGRRDECETLPELIEKIESGEMLKFEALLNIILHYVRFGQIQGYEHKIHKNTELVKAFRKAQPYIEDYLDSYTSVKSLSSLNSVIIVLYPELEEYLLAVYERQKEAGAMMEGLEAFIKSRIEAMLAGAESPELDGESEDMPSSEGMDRPVMKIKFDKKIDLEKLPKSFGSGGGITVEIECPSDDPTEGEEGTPGSEGSSKGEETGTEGSEGEGKGESGTEPEEGSSEEPSEGGTSGEMTDGTPPEETSDTGAAKGGKGDPGMGSGSTGKTPEETDFGEDFEEEVEEEPEEPSEESMKRDTPLIDYRIVPEEKDFDKIEKDLCKGKEEELKTRAEAEDLERLIECIDFGKIHDGYRHQIIRPAVTDSAKATYEALAKDLTKIAKNIARHADFFQEESDPLEIVGKVTGTKFHAERVSKADYKYFGEELPIEPAPNVKVMVSVDMSGSMSGEKVETAMKTCLLMYIFSKMMPTVDIAIFGDTEDFNYPHIERIYCFKDFETDNDSDKYRICTMPRHHLQNNRDGYGLRFCKERLAEQEGDKKLLIRISDGQPAANNYSAYSREVEEDIKGVCSECDREGIAYIAAAIDQDKERIEQYYGSRHFLDISDLSTLPMTLTSLLKKMLR